MGQALDGISLHDGFQFVHDPVRHVPAQVGGQGLAEGPRRLQVVTLGVVRAGRIHAKDENGARPVRPLGRPAMDRQRGAHGDVAHLGHLLLCARFAPGVERLRREHAMLETIGPVPLRTGDDRTAPCLDDLVVRAEDSLAYGDHPRVSGAGDEAAYPLRVNLDVVTLRPPAPPGRASAS